MHCVSNVGSAQKNKCTRNEAVSREAVQRISGSLSVPQALHASLFRIPLWIWVRVSSFNLSVKHLLYTFIYLFSGLLLQEGSKVQAAHAL